MKKNENESKTFLIISTLGIIVLSIINIMKIFYYKGETNIFGYISYIANALAIIALVITWLNLIKQNKQS